MSQITTPLLAAPTAPSSTPVHPEPAASTWHGLLVEWTVEISIVCITLAMFFCVYRLLQGPHLTDRALAVDTLAVKLIGLVILLMIRSRTPWFLDGVLVLSLLSFAGTVAMAQHIARPHLTGKGRENESPDPDNTVPGES